jgi:hypothetical protein
MGWQAGTAYLVVAAAVPRATQPAPRASLAGPDPWPRRHRPRFHHVMRERIHRVPARRDRTATKLWCEILKAYLMVR